MDKFLDLPKWQLALLSGVLIGAAYPPSPLGFLAWFGLVPLIHLLYNASPVEGAKWSFLTGVTVNIITIYWFGLNSGAGLFPVFLSLTGAVLYLSIFWIIFGMCTSWYHQRTGYGLAVLPIFWVGMEYIRSFGPLAFPWINLALTQTFSLPLLQIADVTGSTGISFWIVLINAILYAGYGSSIGLKSSLQIVTLLLVLISSLGVYRISSIRNETIIDQISTAIVQPNIDPNQKWEADFRDQIFNIMATIIFIPFTPFISKTILRYFPDKEELRNIEQPAILNLDEKVLNQPGAAINSAQAEIGGVVGLTERVVGSLVRPFIGTAEEGDVENPDQDLHTGLHQRLDKIVYLNENISDYLVKISRQDLTEKQSKEVFALVSTVNYLDSINNMVKLRFDNLVGKKQTLAEDFSAAGQEEILGYHGKLLKQVKRLNKFFTKFDRAKAAKIMTKGEQYKDLEEKYRLEHFKRVSSDVAESVATHQLHVELMDMLKQINIFIELIAATLLNIE